MVAGSRWEHAYPRELAAFPLPVLRQHKYWPPVARVDNVYGDKNIMCACIPVDAYIEADTEA
jgi:glycine dehydrogenase